MCRHQILPLLALTFALGAAPARLCQAQWQRDGTPICTAAGSQQFPKIVSDGAGGAIVTWEDNRNGNYYDIYARRVSAAGVPQWPTGGVVICTAPQGVPPFPTITTDGAGGAIVAWQDYRNSVTQAIYAQRVSAAGVAQWPTDGVVICAYSGVFPTIVSDDAGGAIVAWADYRSGNGNIYAQRVSAAGAPQWTANGVALSTAAAGPRWFPTIASDGAGGAIVTWGDVRNGPADIYAQRVSADGAPQWTADGVALCTAGSDQPSPTITSDGAGGAIVTWQDLRNGPADIYAQRVSADGAPQWTPDGVALCTAANDQTYPTITSDGAGGAIVTWSDASSMPHAQRVSAAGAPQWTADGVALSTVPNPQTAPTIVSDGSGGAIVTWSTTLNHSSDLTHAQRVSVAGALQWTADGVALSTAAGGQYFPTIVSDGAGGAIVTWEDGRNGNGDIYAQRVYGSGGVTAVPPPAAAARFQLLAPSPNPTRDGQMTIRFNLPSSERVSAEVLDVAGHWVRTLAASREFSPGLQVLGWDGKNDAGVRQPDGVYFVEVREGTHSEARRAILLR
jgi:predicted lipoprotein with Yx(FWY)xxD motif